MTTLVLIPGLVSDTVVWAPLAEAASGLMAVRHADISGGTSITGMARTLLDETDGDIVAVGHSMGGRVAMEMAHIAPERISGLVLANTGHHPKREGEEIKRQQMIDLGNRSIDELAQQWLPPMLDPARVGDRQLIARLHAMVVKAGSQVHERHIRALIGRPDASAYIADLGCPVLLVAARQDGWSPIAQHREIAEAAPDTELVIIENAGHFAPVERPVETAAAITEWLARRFGETQ
ncbi:alpha/beta fold hydrolase [Neorhizobium sp. LjRoot104]|uniref:alpha/beta fold hydrolase n=1 Tax=Neorhizobium sp. LjRoot104 TaxID=3342254 RepID=UPI003ED03CCE